MPAPVDHETRRQFVIAKTSELIALAGIEATTVRTVAKAAGYSTSIVTHYFEDKIHLLTATYLDVVARRRARLLAVSLDGDDPLREATLAMLPMDRSSLTEWAIYCAFLGSAVGKTNLAATQVDSIGQTANILGSLVRKDVEAGRLPADSNVEEVTRDLIFFVTGMGVATVLDPDGHPPQSLKDDMLRELARLRRPE